MAHKTKIILIGLVVLFVCSLNLYGADYKLKWDAVSGDVTGYKIRYGTSVGNYTSTKDVGKVTEYALSNLPLTVGTTYYFVVRAYNATCESDDSDYVTHKVTAVADTTPPLNPQNVSAVLQGEGIRISWQSVTAQDLSGYKVYYGSGSRNYGPSIPVGNVTGYSLTGLEKGQKYYIAVTAIDTSENESGFSLEASIEIPAAIDASPVVSITAPVSNGASYTSTTSTISVTGTATDDKGVNQVKWANSLGGTGTATGTTSWSTGSVSLKDGTNVITVTAYDTAGKTNSASIQISYKAPDATKPTVTLVSPTTGAAFGTTLNTVNITGTATDNTGVSKVTWSNAASGQSGNATGTSNWSVSNVSLIAGTNAITITAYDAANNTGSVTLSVNYTASDTEKPIVKLLSPTTGTTYTQNLTVINLSGTATDNKGVSKVTWSNTASGESGTATGTATWSIGNLTLNAGINAITITATDASNNSASVTLNVTCNPADTIKPVVKLVSPTTGVSYTATQASINLSGTATDNKSVSRVTWSNAASAKNGTAIGTSNWSVGNIELVTGTNEITITAVDTSDNTESIMLSVLYSPPDTQKPVVKLVAPTTGTSYTSSQALINLSGTATDNKSVSKVTWSNSTSGENGTATGTNTWSVANMLLKSGNNAITITAHDGSGNMGSAALSVNYIVSDTEKPIVKLILPTTGSSYIQNQTVINLSGTAADNADVSKVTWSNSASGDSGTATGTNTWSVGSVQLKTGTNAITIAAYDTSNNMGSVTINIICNATDTTKPVIKLVSPTTGTTYTSTRALMNLSGTATDNISVSQVTWSNSKSGKSGTATGTNSWSIGNVALEEGSNPIEITAHDTTGNMNSVTLTVTYTVPDTEKPIVKLASPTTGTSYTVNQASVNLSGTATDNIDVSKVTWSNELTGGSGTASGTETWSTGDIILAEGANPVSVNAYDAAGNLGSHTITVTYRSLTTDADNPFISLRLPVTGTAFNTSSTPLSMAGNASDNEGVVRVTWANSKGGNGTAIGTSDWSVGTIDLKDGQNIITVTAYDRAGNSASHTLAVTYTAPDTVKPVIALSSPTTGTTYDATSSRINLAGTATDNVGIDRVTWTSTTGSFGTASGTANWSINDIELQLGLNTVIVTAMDAAGNKSIHSLTVNYAPLPLTGVEEESPGTGDETPPDTRRMDKPQTDSIQPKEEQKKKERSRNRFLRLFDIGL